MPVPPVVLNFHERRLVRNRLTHIVDSPFTVTFDHPIAFATCQATDQSRDTIPSDRVPRTVAGGHRHGIKVFNANVGKALSRSRFGRSRRSALVKDETRRACCRAAGRDCYPDVLGRPVTTHAGHFTPLPRRATDEPSDNGRLTVQRERGQQICHLTNPQFHTLQHMMALTPPIKIAGIRCSVLIDEGRVMASTRAGVRSAARVVRRSGAVCFAAERFGQLPLASRVRGGAPPPRPGPKCAAPGSSSTTLTRAVLTKATCDWIGSAFDSTCDVVTESPP